MNTELKEGQFRQCYLLCGSQAYLRGQNRDKLEKYLLGDGDRMNVSFFKGPGLQIDQIIEQANALPFFADRRIIILENTGFLGKSKADISAMSERLAVWLPYIGPFGVMDLFCLAKTWRRELSDLGLLGCLNPEVCKSMPVI